MVLKWLNRCLIFGISLAVIGVVSGLYYFTQYARSTPLFDPNQLVESKPSVLYDRYGEVLAHVGSYPRIQVSFEELPRFLVDSILAVEDTRFYEHHGVDLLRIVSSTVSNLQGREIQGASTITQQLVKLSFLDQTDVSLNRKVHEAVLAWKLEDKYSKEQILEYYVNKVYMGQGVYGFATASQYYFSKPLKDLSLAEVALLVGIPNAPNVYNPVDNLDLATKRRDIVLARLHSVGLITDGEYQEASSNPPVTLLADDGELFKAVRADHQEYVDQVYRQLRGKGFDLTEKEYHIYTYLDASKQEALNQLIYKEVGSDLEVSAVLVDKDGGVLALAGGNQSKQLGVLDGFSYPVDAQFLIGELLKPLGKEWQDWFPVDRSQWSKTLKKIRLAEVVAAFSGIRSGLVSHSLYVSQVVDENGEVVYTRPSRVSVQSIVLPKVVQEVVKKDEVSIGEILVNTESDIAFGLHLQATNGVKPLESEESVYFNRLADKLKTLVK